MMWQIHCWHIPVWTCMCWTNWLTLSHVSELLKWLNIWKLHLLSCLVLVELVMDFCTEQKLYIFLLHKMFRGLQIPWFRKLLYCMMLNSLVIFTPACSHEVVPASLSGGVSALQICSASTSWLTQHWNERHVQRRLLNISVRRIRRVPSLKNLWKQTNTKRPFSDKMQMCVLTVNSCEIEAALYGWNSNRSYTHAWLLEEKYPCGQRVNVRVSVWSISKLMSLTEGLFLYTLRK